VETNGLAFTDSYFVCSCLISSFDSLFSIVLRLSSSILLIRNIIFTKDYPAPILFSTRSIAFSRLLFFLFFSLFLYFFFVLRFLFPHELLLSHMKFSISPTPSLLPSHLHIAFVLHEFSFFFFLFSLSRFLLQPSTISCSASLNSLFFIPPFSNSQTTTSPSSSTSILDVYQPLHSLPFDSKLHSIPKFFTSVLCFLSNFVFIQSSLPIIVYLSPI
jgi:hypothetical protein